MVLKSAMPCDVFAVAAVAVAVLSVAVAVLVAVAVVLSVAAAAASLLFPSLFAEVFQHESSKLKEKCPRRGPWMPRGGPGRARGILGVS